QAALDAPAAGQRLAHIPPRTGGLGGDPGQRLAPPRAVPSTQESPRSEESGRRRGRLHAHLGILHAPARCPLPRSGTLLPRSLPPGENGQAIGPPPQRPRLRRGASPCRLTPTLPR